MFKPIPEDRTCESASIPEHWCMCHGRRNVSLDDPALPKVMDFIIGRINGMLARYPQCAHLELYSLVDAKALSDGDDEKERKKTEADKAVPWIDYSITFKTKPGSAIFEGSVRLRTDNGILDLVGSISRLNAYGNQSACVDDSLMRLYCYCR
ncbi:uncharacterized protein LOC106643030 [Copidosoma floridanum]|uniref:uncharacterized protein LOC106643030 n=1 Tax=Copidosoma floridanum TaxID=29053 RepID=UPI0006C97EA9|nr:uncharacterized protein LOC106643030 [Copidosoma floridanum]